MVLIIRNDDGEDGVCDDDGDKDNDDDDDEIRKGQ